MKPRQSFLERLAELGLTACSPDAGSLELLIGADTEPPEWLHLVPFGTWKGYPSGGELRTFVLGPKDAGQIVEYFERRPDLVIDYEHQTLFAKYTGTRAPAAGWVDRLEIREDGVWGHVKRWTSTAAAHIRKSEYRYLSPVLDWHHADERTGRDVGTILHSVALTNTPFLDSLVPVAATSTPLGGSAMNTLFALCLALLGLSSVKPEDATKDQVESAVTDFKARFQAACSALGLGIEAKLDEIQAAATASQDRLTAACSALGLETAASLEDIQAAAARVAGEASLGKVACTALQFDPTKLDDEALPRLKRELEHSGYVTFAEHTAALAQLGGQVEELTDEQLLEQARTAGQLTPALEDWAKKAVKSDRTGFTTWMSTAPKLPVSSSPRSRDDDKPAHRRLTSAELAVCAQLGLTPDEFLATKKEG